MAPKGSVPSPDDIYENIDQIRDQEGYTVPESIADETKAVAKALQGS